MVAKALEDFKVCEFGWVIAGALVGDILAQFGATVVRIESQKRVDILRVMPPFKDNKPGIDRSAVFANYNAGKYSLALDIRRPEGVDIARSLVRWADIVTENFAPGKMEKWGLGYNELKQIRPDLIMLSTSHQGQSGPHASHPGYGTHLAAMTGLVDITGWPDRPGYQLYGAYTDPLVPPLSIAALLAAVDHREKTGEGQYIDMSQLEASMHFMAPLFLDYQSNGRLPQRMGNRCDYAAPHGVFKAKGEDRWCAICVFSDEQWQSFCRILGKPEWVSDTRFSTLLARKRNEDELERLIEEWTTRHSVEDIMVTMQRAGVPAGVVRDNADVLQDPQLTYRNHFVQLDHPEIGRHSYDAAPFQLSGTPREMSSPAPCLGEHTEYVCRQILGMSDEEFLGLVAAGVLQ